MVELSDATGVLSGFRWRGTSVSYAFAESADDYPQTYSPRNETESFSALNAAFRDAARAAFDDLAALVETSATDADIVLGQSDEPFVAWAYQDFTPAALAAVTAVPLPSGALLLGSAALLGAGLRRRQR